MIPRHILIVRTDRMGDMIVTTPLFAAIKAVYPETRLTVLCSAAGAAIARAHPAVDAVEVDPVEAKGSGWRGTLRLARRMRALRCDTAIVVFSKHRLAVALWLARIPVRIGPGQRAYSFLYTHRVAQDHRVLPLRHETSHCLDLLQPLSIDAAVAKPPIWEISAADAKEMEGRLAAHGIVAGQALATVHAGSGGSALNWSPERYAELADCLVSERGMAVVLSGAQQERELVARVAAAMRHPAVNLAGQLSIGQMAALMARSALFVGSSTGPSHLAAAVGVPVVALYCPLAECHPDRWRPQSERCAVLVPPVKQVCSTCLGPQCSYYPCMELIEPRNVLEAAQRVQVRPVVPQHPN